jgi:hypothetical protein
MTTTTETNEKKQPHKGETRGGLIVSVLRGEHESTLNGLTSRFERFILIGEGVPEIFYPSEEMPPLYLNTKYDPPRAFTTPDSLGAVFGNGGMFGGNFVYSSDSRFPHSGPIKVLDRFETPQQIADFSQ